jgi:tetratricopeptide (TPR) repeat protein
LGTLAIDLEQMQLIEASDDALVRSHLAEILASSAFARTPRLRQFLSFVVEKVVAGEGDGLKEYLIATSVYGRSEDYDPQVDSTVRVEASRLRSKLREYYESEGRESLLEIQLPKGTYVPIFVRTRDLQEEQEQQARLVANQPSQPSVRGFAWTGLALAFIAGSLLLAAGSQTGDKRPEGAAALEGELLERFLRAQKLLRTPVLQNGWPGRVPPTVIESIRLFGEVTAKAPRYTPAWVALAEAHEWAYELDPQHQRSRVEAAQRALEEALKLAPSSSDAWSRLGSVYFHQLGDLAQAETAVRRAISLNPRDVASQRRLSDLLRINGRFDEALETVKGALAVDPASPRLWVQRALILYDLSRYDEALLFADHALRLAGGKQQPLAWWVKGSSLERLGRLQEAEAVYREGTRCCNQEVHNRSALAHLLASSGSKAEAESILNCFLEAQKAGQNSGYQIAVIFAGLGQPDQAIQWLHRARLRHETNVYFTGLEKRFEKLREHSSFHALLQATRAAAAQARG